MSNSENSTWRSVCKPDWKFFAAVILSNSARDRKSTRLNSSHLVISYAVFCLKKKKNTKKSGHTKKRRGRNQPGQKKRVQHQRITASAGSYQTAAYSSH